MELEMLILAPFYVMAVIACGVPLLYYIDAVRKQIEK